MMHIIRLKARSLADEIRAGARTYGGPGSGPHGGGAGKVAKPTDRQALLQHLQSHHGVKSPLTARSAIVAQHESMHAQPSEYKPQSIAHTH